ncbi:hypothetical protein [Agromyces larvae]|uniref:Uncharacterized protein n=1 Tax=Agromyces larvae TaxID=2929802 RepID=A0ABY4BUV9_9MICO|nr:hypothetical protein [Agromyces larvae]UOE42998.1 hypothetical protein MTO99_12455 [Agromyces larvae]
MERPRLERRPERPVGPGRVSAPASPIPAAQTSRTVPFGAVTPALIAQLQATAGNASVVAMPVVQRQPVEQQIIDALDKADPVAGVGDFPTAFRLLNGLSMPDLLNTLFRLSGSGRTELLRANLDRATGVNLPRLRLAFDAHTHKRSGAPAAAFLTRHPDASATVPLDQLNDIGRFLDPAWAPLVPLELIPSLSDEELGSEYARALDGDPRRLTLVEDELGRRAGGIGGWGMTAFGSPPAAGTAGETAVTPEVAVKILENYSKGEPPFRPELGKGGASWFVTEGNPYVGIGSDKTVNVSAQLGPTKGSLTFHEADLLEIFTAEREATKVEAEAEFRRRHRIPPEKPLSSRLLKQLERTNGFRDKFAEARMWDRVGQRVAASSSKVGEVVLQNSRFSTSGNGKFLVVADPAKIKLRGGPQAVIAQLEAQGLKAEPVLVEAAEAAASSLKWAGRVRTVLRVGGRVMIVVAVAADIIKIYYAQDRQKAVFESVGGWAGATAGAAAFSAMWAPADVAGPWAWAAHGAGALVAGGIGYWVGAEITRTVYELVIEQ